MGSPEGAQYLGAADVDIQKVISNNFINNNNSFRDLTDVKTIAPDKTTLLENHHLTQCQPC
ncbi:MAG: hypothetical protein KDH96_06520 [Candidatus Riesia sp.]|nr:hypothetical protein [Candidatus Riesia sp.]